MVDGSGVVVSASGRGPALLSTQYISIREHVSANVVRMLGTHQSLRHAVVPITRMYRPSDRGLTPWNRDSSSVLRLAHRADFIDRDREAVLLEANALNWTLIRPFFLVDGLAGHYAGHREAIIGLWTSRVAVADFATRVSDDPLLERTAPFISSSGPRSWVLPVIPRLIEYVGSELPI